MVGMTDQQNLSAVRKACATVAKLALALYVMGCGILIASWCLYVVKIVLSIAVAMFQAMV